MGNSYSDDDVYFHCEFNPQDDYDLDELSGNFSQAIEWVTCRDFADVIACPADYPSRDNYQVFVEVKGSLMVITTNFDPWFRIPNERLEPDDNPIGLEHPRTPEDI